MKLTTAGRAAARAGLGIQRKKATPPGLLSEWLAESLGKLYRAGATGLPMRAERGTPWEDRAPSWNALLHLRDRKDGPYMEEYQPKPGGVTYWVRATPQGIAHYERHAACYAELYPDAELPKVATPPGDAHTGIADHRVPKPRGLLARPAWRLLVALYQCDAEGDCRMRHVVHAEAGREGILPAGLDDMPNGILQRGVERLSPRSNAAEKLVCFRDGALAQWTDVARWRDWRTPPETHGEPLMMLHITQAGRDHYKQHVATYRKVFPDVEAP